MRARLLIVALGLCSFIAGRAMFAPGPVVGRVPVAKVAEDSASDPAVVVERGADAPSSVKLPPREGMKAALDGDDPFASARRTHVWIESLTLEDFRTLATDPNAFHAPYFAGFNNEFSEAYFDALVTRWLTLDPDALGEMKRISEALKKNNPHTNEDLILAAARMRPEEVLTKFDARAKPSGFAQSEWTALRALGRKDLRHAREVLAGMKIESAELRASAESAIIQGVAEVDPLLAVDLAKQSASAESSLYYAMEAAKRIGPGVVRKVVEGAQGKLDYQLSSLLLRYPDLAEYSGNLKVGSLTEEIIRDAEQTTPEDRARILADVDKLPAGGRDVLCAALADAWSREDPAAAAGWVLAHSNAADGPSTANLAAERVFLRWINNDMDAALAWWRTLPPSPMRDRIGAQASTYVAEDGRLDEALRLFPTTSIADRSATDHLAQILIARDPAVAARWMQNLPAEAVTDETVRELYAKWFPRDAKAVADWVESIPAGKVHDRAVKGLISKLAMDDPQAAVEWVTTVRDPKLRTQSAAEVFTPWMRENPEAAREWLRNFPDVDERWRAKALR